LRDFSVAFQRRKPEKIGIKAPLPGFIEPALASKVERVPEGTRWIHEIKFDGYRVQVHIANNDVKIYTRRGHDWTSRFRKIAEDVWHVKAGSAIIDGEVVVPSADGTTEYAVLQNELKGRSTCILLVAFSEQSGSAPPAAGKAQSRAQKDSSRQRHPVQRELYD
jgi:bifunctional non-homologous end joining protein LigD